MRDDESPFCYRTETADQKLHDVLALMSYVHSADDDDLVRYVLRVCKHALAAVKQEVETSWDPHISSRARSVNEPEPGTRVNQAIVDRALAAISGKKSWVYGDLR